MLRSLGPAGAPSEIWAIPACPQGQVRFASDAVQPATEYCYTVIAANESYAEASEQLCVTSALDTTPPILPQVTVTDRAPTRLSWELVDLSTNESYITFESRKLGTSTWRASTFDRGVRAHRGTGVVGAVHSTTLEPGTTYEYRTRIGHDFAPVHVTSDIQQVDTAPPVPETPDGRRFSDIGSSQVTVVWNDVAWETEYVVRVVRKATQAIEKTKTVGANQTSATITGLQPATEYEVDIQARNATGESERSYPLLLTTMAAPEVPHTSSLVLLTAEPPSTGWLSHRASFGPWLDNARLIAIRPIANFPTLQGLRFIREAAPTSDCGTAGQFRFVAVGGALGAADFSFLFGGAGLGRSLALRACGQLAGSLPSEWHPYIDIDWVDQP